MINPFQAEGDPPPTYECRKIHDAFALNGDLFKYPWTEIEPIWFLPATLAAGSHLEEVRDRLHDASYFATGYSRGSDCNVASVDYQLTAFGACWSESHLYLACRCMDADVWSTYTERDEPLYEQEVVEAFLCPTGDPRHYFEINLSPANVVFDAKVHSPDLHRGTMEVDVEWDCDGLETAVSVYGTLNDRTDVDAGWSAEVAIPFTSLGLSETPRPGDVWRANFLRIDRAAPPEFTCWSPTRETPANFHVPMRFGKLRFTT
jgi:hypothetical protein